MKKALILIDLQNDFCEGGSLAVPGGDEVIPLANQLQKKFDLVIATQDWHPKNHASFAANHPGHRIGDVIRIENVIQILWPRHCVQNTSGAAFHPDLDQLKIDKVIQKGIDPKIDSYSAFFDNQHLRSTGLSNYLESQGVKEIFIMGLTTDYCVKYSALDAANLGYQVHVIKDACRGVELNLGDIEHAYHEMATAGVRLIESVDLLKANE